MVALQDDVYKSLSPYFNQFIKCIQDANKEQIDAIVPLSRAKAKKRTRSGLMNDIASHNIRATFRESLDLRLSKGMLKHK